MFAAARPAGARREPRTGRYGCQLFSHRYHAVQITTARQARNALAYVLNKRALHLDREALHVARKRHAMGSLHEEMEMIALDRDVDHAEVIAPEERAEDTPHSLVDVMVPQVGASTIHSERHVHRILRVEVRPSAMRTTATNAGLLATRAAAFATSTRRRIDLHALDVQICERFLRGARAIQIKQ
jgi:hypothetical protein